jgi:hypothetical protein
MITTTFTTGEKMTSDYSSNRITITNNEIIELIQKEKRFGVGWILRRALLARECTHWRDFLDRCRIDAGAVKEIVDRFPPLVDAYFPFVHASGLIDPNGILALVRHTNTEDLLLIDYDLAKDVRQLHPRHRLLRNVLYLRQLCNDACIRFTPFEKDLYRGVTLQKDRETITELVNRAGGVKLDGSINADQLRYELSILNVPLAGKVAFAKFSNLIASSN